MSHVITICLGNDLTHNYTVVDRMIQIKHWHAAMQINRSCSGGQWVSGGNYYLDYVFENPDHALLFKLTWGGR